MEMNDWQIRKLLERISRKQHFAADELMKHQEKYAENDKDDAARLLMQYYSGVEDACKFIASWIEEEAK